MEDILEKELGRLCRGYAACCMEVERKEEADGLKKALGELCGEGRKKLDIGNPQLLLALMDAYEVTRDEEVLQEVLDVVGGHLDALSPSLEAVKLLAYCYYYVEEEECAVKAREMLACLRKMEGQKKELAEVERIVEELI